jgi:hypothetical protein
MHRFRSPVAVLAGLLTIIVLSNGVDAVLEATGIFPSLEEQRINGFYTPWMVVLALSYRVAFGFVGGRVTAALAPASPSRHVAALVIIGALRGLAGTSAVWGITSAWFSIAVMVLTPAAAWLGGRQPSAAHRFERERRQPARI